MFTNIVYFVFVFETVITCLCFCFADADHVSLFLFCRRRSRVFVLFYRRRSRVFVLFCRRWSRVLTRWRSRWRKRIPSAVSFWERKVHKFSSLTRKLSLCLLRYVSPLPTPTLTDTCCCWITLQLKGLEMFLSFEVILNGNRLVS